jgi:zinc transporter
MISMRLWIDKNRIISIQRRQLQSTHDIQSLIENNQAPKDAGDFLCLLIAKLLHYITPAINMLDDKIDTLEEKVMLKPEKSLRENIITIRSETISFRRYLLPQRDVIYTLHSSEITWIHKSHKRKLQEDYDIITRHIEDLEAMRERTHIITDELSNNLSDTLNRNLYILSVVSAIFLPLHFFAGLLGVNLAGIPNSTSPFAFPVFCIMLVILVIIQIFFFKKYKVF